VDFTLQFKKELTNSWCNPTLNSKLNVRMGKKGDLNYFEHRLLVPDGLVWVFHNLLNYWDFHAQPFLGFTKNGVKGEKNIQYMAVLWAKMPCWC